MFEKLKRKFIIKLVLVTLDLDKGIRVKINMLDFVIGRVLLIKCENEKRRLVAYISKSLNKIKSIIML